MANSNILFELQHGFKEKRSWETQLIRLEAEIFKNMQPEKQTDLIRFDFSKVNKWTFDKIGHENLMSKLYFYGVRGKLRFWIKDFLDIHSQAVVLNGSN